jgi:hypothetical protein
MDEGLIRLFIMIGVPFCWLAALWRFLLRMRDIFGVRILIKGWHSEWLFRPL